MSSTSITATWVTLRPWIWLCATSAEYFIAIINIIVWGSQNTCISQVLFCHTHARGNLVFAEGFLAPIQTPVVCLFPHSKQPNSLYLSFQLEFLGQIWCRLVCFPVLFTTEAESATEYTIFIPSHTNDKSRTPPLCVLFLLFFFFIFDDEGTISLQVHCGVCFYPRAYTCLHHQMAHAANLARRRFPRMQWSGTVCDLTSKWGGGVSSAPGLAGRLDASWHVAESVILRGRPGAHKKKKKWSWYLPLPFCSFNVISGWVILALILCLCVMSY